ncbi:kunitz-type protease inhibitor 2 [Bufo gargarizans]|uniref:kunitz-type protease inhibitor 2 n=1 Tax=Bufo gargarizans TaxID=30331 RepID=UPI001CF2696A|nr:kunitz-type protease inhibitor 2 [Bufo gargarizans]
MAAWLRGLLVLLIPLALADTELPCDGYEVVEGFGLEDVEAPSQFGVKLLEPAEEVEDERTCWSRCCDNKACDLASVSAGKCYLIRCNVVGFDMSGLTQMEGARTYKKQNLGVQPTQEDFCLPEKKTGDCRAFFTRWWYNAETETCQNFTYGGCPVNLNNHMGEEECMQKCQGLRAVKVRNAEAPSKRMVSALSVPDYCSGSGVTGNCRASFPRWYFDAESMSCQQFTYGGCGGSKNNHLSEQECMAKCVGPKPEPEKVHAPKKGDFAEYCAASYFTGPCRAAFKRWFYDPTSSSCKTFVYGGCGSKSNNYLNEADCMDMCSGRTEDEDFADHSVMHRSVTAVVLPILLALLAATLVGIMILFFVKVARKNQETAGFRAMWNPIDDKECLMNSAYTL